MTQQIDHTYASTSASTSATGVDGPGADVLATTVVPKPRSAPPGTWAPPRTPAPPAPAMSPVSYAPPAPPAGLAPMPPYGPGMPGPGQPFVPARRSSGGRTVGIVLGVVGAVAVLLVILLVVLGSLFSSASTPAPAAPATPSSAPASPPAGTSSGSSSGSSSSGSAYSGTTAVLAPAGKRLEAARTTLDQQLTAASDAKDAGAFRDAFSTFGRELEAYKASVAGLPMPADQQAAFATLNATVDAAIADCHDVAATRTAKGLSAPAGRFDGHWTTLVATHNQIIEALPAR